MQTWHILEQIQDHQVALLARPGTGLRCTTRDKLEGFGFKDIVEGNRPLLPRVATLSSSGKGWVDFAKEIYAINLLGNGFGELIRARDASGLCDAWKHVPKGRDYLVATVEHLKRICEVNGDACSDPLEIARGIYWHKGKKLFEPCSGCKRNRFGATCDRVQVLLPPSLRHRVNPKPFKELNGGVIFGRSEKYRWFFSDRGDPVEENGHEPRSGDAVSSDRGSGTSIDTTLSQSADSGLSLSASTQNSSTSDS